MRQGRYSENAPGGTPAIVTILGGGCIPITGDPPPIPLGTGRTPVTVVLQLGWSFRSLSQQEAVRCAKVMVLLGWWARFSANSMPLWVAAAYVAMASYRGWIIVQRRRRLSWEVIILVLPGWWIRWVIWYRRWVTWIQGWLGGI